jgi:hypothetical protein
VLPNSSGFHEITFNTWILQGNLQQETLGFFLSILYYFLISLFISEKNYLLFYLDSKPMMNTSDPVSASLDQRKYLITKPGPAIHLNVDVILRNFTFNSISGKKN